MKKYHKHNRFSLLAAMIAIFFSSIFAVVLQFFKGDVLDHAVLGHTADAIRSGINLIVFILLEVTSYYFFQRLSARYAIGCIRELRQDLMLSILNRSFVDYSQKPLGEYISKYTTDSEAIRDQRFRMLPMLWEILFRIILVSFALLILNWRLALITIALLTTPLYLPKLIESRLQKAQQAYLQAMEENLEKITDWLSGFEIIKNYSIEQKILEQFRNINGDASWKLMQNTQLGAVSQLITTLISYLSYFVVLAYAAILVLAGHFSAGDFFVSVGMIDQLSYPLISLAEIIRQLVAIGPVCQEMDSFLKSSGADLSSASAASPCSQISCHHISFSYDRNRPILDNFDFTIKKGERCLLQGPSGCGKTTLINLLLGYYVPTNGNVEVDGNPLRVPGSMYHMITVVRQEAVLFHDTLRNNLTMYQDIPDRQIFHVLQSVGLSKYANADALKSIVMQNGTNFSGGEKKRLCLARALLRDTDVLILDEPLANLDAATAEQIEDLLLSIPDKTLLIVSHQFTESKLVQFDKVVDLKNKHTLP